MTQVAARPTATPPPPPPPPAAAPPTAPPTRRPWMRSTKISVAVLVVVVLLQVTAFVGHYLLWTGPYVTTINAAIDGDQVQINAPADGTLVRWSVAEGSVVQPGQAIGRIKLDGSGFSAPQQVIRSPGRGRVAMDMAVEGQRVSAGTTLALAFEDDDIYVTARVPTTVIGEVRVGAAVDLAVDAYPDTRVTGVVSEIQDATAGEFSIYPSPDINPQAPQKVKEWVPVKITFLETGGAAMVPGLNVTARIHRSG